MIWGPATFRAAAAAALSPEAIASSTLRTEVRMRERRAMLISVRRAITRVALRAEEVLAIDFRVRAASRQCGRFQVLKNNGRRNIAAGRAKLIKTSRGGVNGRKTADYATFLARAAV